MGSTFQTTPWSLVLQAADPTTAKGQAAFGELFELSWYPLYTFLRRSEYSTCEAEDLLQGFYAKLLEKQAFRGLSAGRGRFRNFLLVCLQRYASNERQRAHAEKRGGGKREVAIGLPTADYNEADRRYQIEPVNDLTAERIYHRNWALAMLDRALNRLADANQTAGKGELFEHLKIYLAYTSDTPTHVEMGQKLGMSSQAVKTAVHRLRAQFRESLCDVVAETLDRGELLEDEIRQLFSALKL